jgi:hypothetical protein
MCVYWKTIPSPRGGGNISPNNLGENMKKREEKKEKTSKKKGEKTKTQGKLKSKG